MRRVPLTDEHLTEVRNIIHGAFAPLTGFMDKRTVLSVLEKMKLPDGTTWPLPIILDVPEPIEGEAILTDKDGNDVAKMAITDTFQVDRDHLCRHAFATTDPDHPGVAHVHALHRYLIGGTLEEIDCPYACLTPSQLRQAFRDRGWRTIVAFQTRNPPHRAHEYLQRCALEMTDGLLIQPVIGKKKQGDFRDPVIMGAYHTLIDTFYPTDRVILSPLPLTMRYAGPREALLHAIVRRNFGCTHFIFGRDHAGVGDYYGPFDAHGIFDAINDLGITILRMDHALYCPVCDGFVTQKTCPHNDHLKLSGTEVRRRLQAKEELPKEFMRKAVFDHIISHDTLFVD